MVRPVITPPKAIEIQFRTLTRLVRNLLIDNKNLQVSDREDAYYFQEFPKTHQYVWGPLREHAEAIVERIDEIREIAVDFATLSAESLEEASDADLILALEQRGYTVTKQTH